MLSSTCSFSYTSPVLSTEICPSDTLVLGRCPQRQDSVSQLKGRVAAEHAAPLTILTYFYQPNAPVKIKAPGAVQISMSTQYFS